jgi:hypothetical protein
MANTQALKDYVFGLKGDRLFNTGIVGSTSQLQQQLIELRKSFALFSAHPDNQELMDNFRKELLTAHVVSLITDSELDQCETWLEDNSKCCRHEKLSCWNFR